MKDVAIDACCLINLLAADGIVPKPTPPKKKRVLANKIYELPALGLVLHLPAIVASESLYILQPDHDDPVKLIKSPIDLASYFSTGLLHQCEVEGEHEMIFFVNFARRLDDGEAACMAVAKNREWFLATDDKLATNIAIENGVAVLTTVDLLKRWASTTKASTKEVATVLQRIQRFAKFVPRNNSPEATWWQSQLKG